MGHKRAFTIAGGMSEGITAERHLGHRKMMSSLKKATGFIAGFLFVCSGTHAQPTLDECKVTQPISMKIINDRHPANQGLLQGEFCVQDVTVSEDLCLPSGTVAGEVLVNIISKEGLGWYRVSPSEKGAHCKTVSTYIRPDHSGSYPFYICLSHAKLVVQATLFPSCRSSSASLMFGKTPFISSVKR